MVTCCLRVHSQDNSCSNAIISSVIVHIFMMDAFQPFGMEYSFSRLSASTNILLCELNLILLSQPLW
jgi:hypothetical protein